MCRYLRNKENYRDGSDILTVCVCVEVALTSNTGSMLKDGLKLPDSVAILVVVCV